MCSLGMNNLLYSQELASVASEGVSLGAMKVISGGNLAVIVTLMVGAKNEIKSLYSSD
jgi:hypothetical protein